MLISKYFDLVRCYLDRFFIKLAGNTGMTLKFGQIGLFTSELPAHLELKKHISSCLICLYILPYALANILCRYRDFSYNLICLKIAGKQKRN